MEFTRGRERFFDPLVAFLCSYTGVTMALEAQEKGIVARRVHQLSTQVLFVQFYDGVEDEAEARHNDSLVRLSKAVRNACAHGARTSRRRFPLRISADATLSFGGEPLPASRSCTAGTAVPGVDDHSRGSPAGHRCEGAGQAGVCRPLRVRQPIPSPSVSTMVIAASGVRAK